MKRFWKAVGKSAIVGGAAVALPYAAAMQQGTQPPTPAESVITATIAITALWRNRK